MKERLKKILLGACCLCAIATVGGAIATSAMAEGSPSLAQGGEIIGYKPDIHVAWGEYSSENVPMAIKGECYALFSATAEDLYGNDVPVSVKAYLHYLEPNQSSVTIRDNAVTPLHYGIYTVEYTAKDQYGNVQVYTYDFKCEETETLELTLSEAETQCLIGYQVDIATVAVENAVGNYTTKITATSADGKISCDLTGKSSFTPTYASTYTIEYEVRDYNVTAKDSYELKADKHDEPIVFEEAVPNRYYIVGKEYVLPSAKAYQFSTGMAVETVPKITVSCGKEKAVSLAADRKFTPKSAGELTIVYTFAYGANTVEKTYIARAVDTGYANEETFSLTKYFYSENALIKANSNAITVETETKDTQVEFINAAFSRRFNFAFAFAAGGYNFTQLDLCLTDRADPSVQLKASLIRSNEQGSTVLLNGKNGQLTTASFYSTKSVQFAYSEEEGNVLTVSDVSFKVTEDLEGKAFDGFPSGKVYFSCVFKGVEGRAKITMNSIGNQPLYNASADNIEPWVIFKTYDGNKCRIGDLIMVDRIYLQDMLDPDYTLEYSITTPSGAYVIDENGLLLSEANANYAETYVFRARELGSYSVNMKVSDSRGNNAIYAYAIVVEDCNAPSVQLKEKVKTEIKQGESFTIGDLLIKDDHSLECSVYVCVLTPSLISYEVNVGDSFKANAPGRYTVCYTVVDEVGNTAFLTYEINVV